MTFMGELRHVRKILVGNLVVKKHPREIIGYEILNWIQKDHSEGF
jgi:hypothetical protein